MNVVVFGAGSLGSLVGGVLAREHDVTLVAREAHAEAVSRNGLRLEGFDFVASDSAVDSRTRVSPTATTDGGGLEAELAIVTVKSFDTEAAARTLATGTYDAVLSLQNGMGNEETLADHLESSILAGTATYGAIVREPGLVECTGRGEIVLGPRAGGTSPIADRVGAAFQEAGLETDVVADAPRRLWGKLAVNAGINAVTALTRVANGGVLERPANDLARAATRETARVARADGVTLSNREALASVESVAARTAENTSSMLQDVSAGRRTEIDAINGYVVERADRRRLEVPTNRHLASLIRTWERGQGLR